VPDARANANSPSDAPALTHIALVMGFVRFRTVSAPSRYPVYVSAAPSANTAPIVSIARPAPNPTTTAAPPTAHARASIVIPVGVPRPSAHVPIVTNTGT